MIGSVYIATQSRQPKGAALPTTFIRCFATADAARASAPRGSDWQVVCTPAGEPVAFPIEGLAGLIAASPNVIASNIAGNISEE